MVKLRKNINILAILLIPVYLLVMGNSTRNRHTHMLANGLVITHAHPFCDSKTGLPVKHNHSQNQMLFFQLFTFDFFHSSPEVFLAENDISFRHKINVFQAAHISVSFISATFLRGPPVA
jgi:hypothetical protein